ncbi:MAG TPA: phosphohistidine phosphatase SixA [Candidatus Eisenbacteria bacterium]|jgi:phosphohistidine phosphatase|nr:phosphohistidine phosphatase SixA [Candidatus Eisenbacteria bacterium]
MRLVLFRHGPAGERDAAKWPDDAKRPLTAKGVQKTKEAAKGLIKLEKGISLILTSPLTRAAETAQVLKDALGDRARIVTLDELSPGGSNRALIAHLADLPQGRTVVAVGHEPGLGKLAALLALGSGTTGEIKLKKAGAAALRFEGPARAGAGDLVWLLPRRMLARLGKGRRKKAIKEVT